MKQYVVLKPISPQQGPIIFPAEAEQEPVLIDATLISGDDPAEHAANVARLIEQGVIEPYEPPKSVRAPKAAPDHNEE